MRIWKPQPLAKPCTFWELTTGNELSWKTENLSNETVVGFIFLLVFVTADLFTLAISGVGTSVFTEVSCKNMGSHSSKPFWVFDEEYSLNHKCVSSLSRDNIKAVIESETFWSCCFLLVHTLVDSVSSFFDSGWWLMSFVRSRVRHVLCS